MAAPVFETPAVIITEAEELNQLVDTLLTYDQVAIDTESDNFYRYHKRICLVQITAKGVDYIIDPLKTGDLSGLGRLLTSTDIEKVFHGGENDLTLFMDTLGIRVCAPYFDTYIAAQIAGEQKVGFGALVGQYFDMKLDKRFQLHDWGERPISPQAMAYARGDTHFLLPLRDQIWSKVAERGREDHALEEFDRLLAKVRPSAPFDPNSCLRIKGTRGMKPRQLTVLMQLHMMRDAKANELNLAPFRVLANELILALSKSQPATQAALEELPLYRDRGVRRLSDRIIEAILIGQRADAPMPKAPPKTGHGYDKDLEERLRALKGWRKGACTTLGMPPGVLASNAILTEIAAAKPADKDALETLQLVRQWQVNEFGDQWLDILKTLP